MQQAGCGPWAPVCQPLDSHIGRSVLGRKEGKVYLGNRGNSLDKDLKVEIRIISQGRGKISVAHPGPMAKGAWDLVMKGLGDAARVSAHSNLSHMKAWCRWPPCAVRKLLRRGKG